jgi:hypothetical protein
VTCDIPVITHPLGRSWRQPSLDHILVDDTHAVMSRCTFEELHEYSGTMPTGVYEGKMWRRHNGIYDRAFLAAGGKPNWTLCWYGPSDKPDMCSINVRDILIIGETP